MRIGDRSSMDQSTLFRCCCFAAAISVYGPNSSVPLLTLTLMLTFLLLIDLLLLLLLSLLLIQREHEKYDEDDDRR